MHDEMVLLLQRPSVHQPGGRTSRGPERMAWSGRVRVVSARAFSEMRMGRSAARLFWLLLPADRSVANLMDCRHTRSSSDTASQEPEEGDGTLSAGNRRRLPAHQRQQHVGKERTVEASTAGAVSSWLGWHSEHAAGGAERLTEAAAEVVVCDEWGGPAGPRHTQKGLA